MSLNIDMKMIRPVNFSGVTLNLNSNSRTLLQSCNVVNPGKIVGGPFSVRVPRSSTEVRRVFVHDIVEVEVVGQKEGQGDQRDGDEEEEVNGDVEERQQSEQQMPLARAT